MKRGLKHNISGWLFTAPMLIGLTIFMFGPLLYAFYMSFLEWPLLGEKTFIGFGNYERLMSDDKFLTSLKNTFIFSAGLVPLNLALALGLALLLKDQIFGIGLFRTVIVIPVIASLIVSSIVWKYMLAPEFGFINQLLATFNLKGPAWLL